MTFIGDGHRGLPRRVIAAATIGLMTMLCIGGSAAAAPPPPATEALLAQARRATGAAAWQRLRAIAVTGTMSASGLDAEYVADEDVRDGRFDHRLRFPVFTQRDVWDGRTFWRQENSGGVHRLDGDFAQRRNATAGWLVRRGWLRRDRGGAWFGPVSRGIVDGRDVAVVTAVPVGGQPVTLSFDAVTLDLVRAERVMPISVQETRFADYRDVDGVRARVHPRGNGRGASAGGR
jgi:hypothetical protein